MAITATDLQEMVTHWLGCRVNGYLGSGYGSSVPDLLHTPLSGPAADALLAKLRSDIAVMAQLRPDQLHIYAEPRGVDRLDLMFEVAGNFIRLDDVAPFVRPVGRMAAAPAPAPPPEPVGDPFEGQVVLRMAFEDSLVDDKGNTFLADGEVSYVDDWLGGRAVSIGGATSGLGGDNVIYSQGSNIAWALQGDVCIEVAGRINSNISRPRMFIRIAQGSLDLAQIYADTSGSVSLGAGFITSPSSTHIFGGPTYTYGAPYHLAIQRIGTTIKFYVNGVDYSTAPSSSYYPPNEAPQIYIGNNRRFFVDAMDGEIAWAKITNAARYTGPFTPPTGP